MFIILSIIAAVGLTYLLAGLACTLSCNGSEGAAILVMVMGVIAIVCLLTVVIKKILNHNKKVKDAPANVKPD